MSGVSNTPNPNQSFQKAANSRDKAQDDLNKMKQNEAKADEKIDKQDAKSEKSLTGEGGKGGASSLGATGPDNPAGSIAGVGQSSNDLNNTLDSGAGGGSSKVQHEVNNPNQGTDSGTVGASTAAGAADAARTNLQNNDPKTFSSMLTMSVSEGASSIANTVGASIDGGVGNRGSIDNQQSGATGLHGNTKTSGDTTSISNTDHAAIQKIESNINTDTQSVNTARTDVENDTKALNEAVKQYGGGSPQANAASTALQAAQTKLNDAAAKLLDDIASLSGYKDKYEGNATLEQAYNGYADCCSAQLQANNAATLKAAAADLNALNNTPMTDKSAFGNYNPAVFSRSSVQFVIMAAMIHMSKTTSSTAQLQSKVESFMQKHQKLLNNALQTKLQGENALLNQLKALGQKEYSESQVNSGLLALPGNLFGSLGDGGEMMAGGMMSGMTGGLMSSHCCQTSWCKHSAEGLGETFGFTSGVGTVQGEVVAANAELTHENSGIGIDTQKVQGMTTGLQGQSSKVNASAQAQESVNQLMTNILSMWAKAAGQISM